MRTICLICMLCLAVVVKAASPIQGLLERIDKGASRKFVIEQVKSPTDFFDLEVNMLFIKTTCKRVYREKRKKLLSPNHCLQT